MPDARRAGRLPFPVPLNHFFVVPDAVTYTAITESEFLRKEFAAVETRTTVRADTTYTGFYLYGAHTYFEFLRNVEDNSIREGDSGLALGVDRSGDLRLIEEALPAEFPGQPSTITRSYDDRPVPWFFMAWPKSVPYKDPSGFSFWLMEYHPRFLAEWKPQTHSANRGVARQKILQRYAATLAEKPSRPLFQDVIGLELALDEPQAAKLIEICEVFGYKLRNEKKARVLQRPDFDLRLIPVAGKLRGIRQVNIRLSRKPSEPQEYRFGTSALRLFLDGSASWTFS